MTSTDKSNRAGCLIGLDLGTTGLKGVLTDCHGVVLGEAERATRFQHPHPGWFEVDAHDHFRNVCGLIRELAATAPAPVLALSMAGATGNTLLTDAAGTPLMPIINWMDQRAAQQPPPLLEGLTPEAVARIAGWPCTHSFPLAHLAWLQANRPDLFAAAGHYGMDSDWLLFQLTGRWAMDPSTATTFLLQDQRTGRYHEPFLRLLGIPLAKLSPLIASGRDVGPLTPAAAAATGLSVDTRVVTGCFDHPAAARAMGVTRPGQLMLSCGTSWVGFAPVADRDAVLAAGLLCDPFLSHAGGPWGGMFSVPSIGRTIDVYMREIVAPGSEHPARIFDALAAEASPGAGGLTLDLTQPPAPPEASRANIARAVMEGAARLLRDRMAPLKARGFAFREAVMVGGPTQSPVWPGIVADMLDLKLTLGGRSAGARGAALLAGEGLAHRRECVSV